MPQGNFKPAEANSRDFRGVPFCEPKHNEEANSRFAIQDTQRTPIERKKSCGIACVRYNPRARQYEILMVRRRYTYSFFDFVWGRYARNDERTIIDLLNTMTNQEKLDILSMDFDVMWWRIWLARSREYGAARNLRLGANSADSQEWTEIYRKKSLRDLIGCEQSAYRQSLYIKKKAKFERFLIDGGIALNKLVRSSIGNEELMWEIPKGGRQMYESELECAMREFGEETGVKPHEYRVLDDITPFHYSYSSRGVTYTYKFFIAVETCRIDPSISFNTYSQLIEIDSIKWIGATELRFLCCQRALPPLLIKIFNVAKKRCKRSMRHYIKNLYSYFDETASQ